MSRHPTTSTLTMEFGHELEQERHAWLRRRFMWYCGVMFVLSLATQVGNVFGMAQAPTGMTLLNGVLTLIALGTYATAFSYIARHPKPKIPPLRLASGIVLGLGLLTLAATPIITLYTSREIARQVENGAGRGGIDVRLPGGGLQVQNDPVGEPPRPADNASPSGSQDVSQTPASIEKAPEAGKVLSRAEKVNEISAVLVTGFTGLWTILTSHFIACIFLPWTGQESLRPVIPLLVVNGVMTVAYAVYNASVAREAAQWPILWLTLGFLAASLLTPMPGLGVCWWRHHRFRRRATFDVLRDRYSALKHELTSARQIHESLFPMPVERGECLFRYEYEPMRQIGGDYLHAFETPAESPAGKALSLVVVDVTGHGIPAALTVNRLHGELARIFAENPGVGPGEVLRLLNSYVHLTLATHSVYVTAMCFRACARSDTLEYASGGHPPAFVRSIDGKIERLDSTALVLGVAAGPDFHPEAVKIRFGPGDALIAYTDGATEARDEHGRYFGIEGIQRLLATAKPDASRGWPGTLRRAVEAYRKGPTMDDVLVIELRRPLGATGSS
jgi:serine phosphatase RsbU (regulator of sigma subunit)